MAFTSTYHRDLYPAIEAAQSSASGKYVLMTGASQGLGRAFALSWARAGASGIAICSRNLETLQPVATELKEVNAKTQEKFGKLDVVIANVGLGESGIIGQMDEELWWEAMNTHVRSTQLTAHHYFRVFGPDLTDTFISLASGIGTMTLPSLSAYALSKAACIQFMKFLDVEYPNLKAFAIDPGVVKDIATLPAFIPFVHDTPELVGAFSIWLASGKADKIKGGYVHVTWDVDQLEKHGGEIKDKGLLKSNFLGGY